MARKPTGRAARGRKPGAGPPPIYEWDRRPGEGPEAYQAFLVYRDLGPSRSLARVRQRWTEAGPSAARANAPALSQLKDWSSRWAWSFRTDAWDAHLQRLADERIRQVFTEQIERHRILGDAALVAVTHALNLVINELTKTDEKGKAAAAAPNFGTVISAAETVVSLQQKIAASAVERLERAVAAGPMAGAREELVRRLTQMADVRRRAADALDEAQKPQPAVEALKERPPDGGTPAPA